MIPAELQARDEALTAAGHDPECAAYDDRDCSCGVDADQIPAATMRSSPDPRVHTPVWAPPATASLSLTGAAATSHARMIAAGQRTRELQAALQQAEAEFRAALAEHLEACTR